MGSSNGYIVKSMDQDNFGNIYITGSFSGTADFDPGPGLFNITSLGMWDIFISKLDSSGNLIWVQSVGGTGNDLSSNAITIDDFGYVLITGCFDGTNDFDPGLGIFNLSSAGPSSSSFVSKLDSNGTFVWAKALISDIISRGYSISADTSGNIYTTGFFRGTMDFDPGTGVFNLISSVAGNNVFISKLNASGNFVWAKSFEGYGINESSHATSLAIDDSENVYITGYFEGAADFDPGSGIYYLTAMSGEHDIFISKLNASGDFVWAKQIGGTGWNNDYGSSVAVDNFGYVYVTGAFSGTADFDPGIGSYFITAITSSGDRNLFISKLDASGNLVWVKSMGGVAGDGCGGASIALDEAGNIYTTGFFFGTVDFDPGLGNYNLTSSGSSGAFISKINNSGIFVWAKILIGSNFVEGVTLSLMDSLNIYTAGYFGGTADFNPDSSLVYNLTSVGNQNIFIVKLSTCFTPSNSGNISGDTSICSGSTNIYYITPVTGATSYFWSLPTGWSGNSTTNTISTTAGSLSGIISVTATNACGSSPLQTLAVTVISNIELGISISILPAGPICEGASVTFSSVSTNAGLSPVYQWKLNGANVGLNSPTYINSSLANGDIVKCVLTSSATCILGNPATSNSIIMTVNPMPPVPTITEPTPGTLHSSAPSGNQWYRNTLIIPSATAQDYTYTLNGIYSVTVSISGCSSTSPDYPVTTVGISPLSFGEGPGVRLYPNPFYNELFITSSEIILSIEIYNLLGEKVFSQLPTANCQLPIDLSNSPSGIYFLSLKTSEGKITKKLVKM